MLPHALFALFLLSPVQPARTPASAKRPLGGRDVEAQHVLGSPSVHHGLDAKADRQNPLLHTANHRRPTGFVAFGDSYSAGIGTHVEGKENECRQGQGAYPYLINKDILERRGHSNITSFQWLSCTGAVTEDVLLGGKDSQIARFNASYGAPDLHPDFATLSIGGNDLGFFDVMNACVFRFYSFYSGTCEAALAASDRLLNNPEFELRLSLILTEILDKARWERHPWFVITVTGYARFFNADTAACDDASLGVWWGGAKLERAVRQRMNLLVATVNAKLRQAVDNFNARFYADRVFFVDYDALFDGHRFCEPNVTEPDYNRTETWFFLPGGPDNGPGTVPGPPGPPPPPNMTAEGVPLYGPLLAPGSPLVDPKKCLPAATRLGDWGELALCYMAMAKQREPALRPAHDRVQAQHSMWYVPTYYGKTFHPRTLGHRVIRDKVYKVWKSQGYL